MKKIKTKIATNEGSEVVTKCNQLKMQAADGKFYLISKITMPNLFLKFKIKNLVFASRIFDVDRGGVEPLKQSDESAPGTLRTRPSDPQKYISSIYINEKAPTNRSFSEPRMIPFKADSSLTPIVHPSKTMSIHRCA